MKDVDASPPSWDGAAGSPRQSTTRRIASLRGVVLCVALAVMLVGCGGDDDPDPTPTSVPATESAAPPAESSGGTPTSTGGPQAAFGEIVWATSVDPQSKAPMDRVDRVPVDAASIYAVIPITRVAAGTELTADWTYNDTPIDGVSATAVVTDVSGGLIWVEFHLERSSDRPWPDGTYAIAIRQNGEVVAGGEVEVSE